VRVCVVASQLLPFAEFCFFFTASSPITSQIFPTARLVCFVLAKLHIPCQFSFSFSHYVTEFVPLSNFWPLHTHMSRGCSANSAAMPDIDVSISVFILVSNSHVSLSYSACLSSRIQTGSATNLLTVDKGGCTNNTPPNDISFSQFREAMRSTDSICCLFLSD
jgi:hypothetical protein